MDKYFEAWQVMFDYEKELRAQGRNAEATLLLQAGVVMIERSSEESEKERLEAERELEQGRERRLQEQLQLRTTEAPRPQPQPVPTPTRRQHIDDAPYGSIGGVVHTEWGIVFNIKQKPS